MSWAETAGTCLEGGAHAGHEDHADRLKHEAARTERGLYKQGNCDRAPLQSRLFGAMRRASGEAEARRARRTMFRVRQGGGVQDKLKWHLGNFPKDPNGAQ